jgi:cobalt-zinc-cadmium efflux system protein
MQSTPRGVDIGRIKHELEQLKGIANIHHIHTWRLSDHQVHFECHVDLMEDMNISATNAIQQKIESFLHDGYGINHVTIQFEYNVCDNKEAIIK